MNALSEKYLGFVNSNLYLLNSIDDIKDLENEIITLITYLSNNPLLYYDRSELNEKVDSLSYLKMRLDGAVASINMYCSQIIYENTDLTEYVDSTKKYAYTQSSSISKNIFIQSFIPSFNVQVINLGFNGIEQGDILRLRMYSDSITEETTLDIVIPLEKVITGIGQSTTISVGELACPTIPYEYNLEVRLIDKNNKVYMTYVFDGINIKEA